MLDDFDSNGYGGDDYDGDGKVSLAEQDLDDNDITYNSAHPYRGNKRKGQITQADEDFAKFWHNSSKAGKIQMIVCSIIYCVLLVVVAVICEVNSSYILLIVTTVGIIPYAIMCLLISAFIIEPIIKILTDKKNNKNKEK